MVAGLPVGKRSAPEWSDGEAYEEDVLEGFWGDGFQINPGFGRGSDYTDDLKLADVEGVKSVLREIIEDLTPKGENDATNEA